MKLKRRLQAQAKKSNSKFEIIQKDYLLSIILESVARVPELKNNIVFKGGTALKKMYFGNYRFSEDLDFSLIREYTYLKDNLEGLIEKVCVMATERCRAILGEDVYIKSAPYLEDKPHPEGQLAFVIRVQYPWNRDFHTKVYAEFTFQELVVMPPVSKTILHEYGDLCEGELLVYSLEEIIAEKIRALHQFAKKLHERGWARSRVRDYYDIWMILTTFSKNLNLDSIPDLVKKKCVHKSVAFKSIEDLFQEALMIDFKKEWEAWLSDMVPELPDKEVVLKDLKKILVPLFHRTVPAHEEAKLFEKQ